MAGIIRVKNYASIVIKTVVLHNYGHRVIISF